VVGFEGYAVLEVAVSMREQVCGCPRLTIVLTLLGLLVVVGAGRFASGGAGVFLKSVRSRSSR
jgi:hypothetical protein